MPHRIVFIGGASISLHIDDPAVQVRSTRDVDFVIEATSYAATSAIEHELRQLGFSQALLEDEPLCRWHKDSLILDMIPTEPTVLGFGENPWFERGFSNALRYTLPNQRQVWSFDTPHLLATKIVAFEHRGEGDWLASRDIEDIVTLFDGRRSLITELQRAGSAQAFVRSWLGAQAELLDMLTAHVGDDARGELLSQQISQLISDNET